MTWTIFPPGLSKQFQTAAQRNAVHIGYDNFLVLEDSDPETHLITSNTSVCAGVALVPRYGAGNVGLMHMFSDMRHEPFGQAAVRRHVSRGWEKFVKAVNPNDEYIAVSFGGQGDRNYSVWMNDALAAFAKYAAFVTKHHDFRYQGAPHDAIIDRINRQIIVGTAKEKICGNLGFTNPANKRRKIFDTLEIT